MTCIVFVKYKTIILGEVDKTWMLTEKLQDRDPYYTAGCYPISLHIKGVIKEITRWEIVDEIDGDVINMLISYLELFLDYNNASLIISEKLNTEYGMTSTGNWKRNKPINLVIGKTMV